MADAELRAEMGDTMPFDGMRMTWGGFRPRFEAKAKVAA